ncbi:MAG: heat shock protein HspQ [Alphaproteobacteria bacterium]|nr:heat shock protein HspQ [Alphaproteobacteria bacterium]
MDDPDTNDEGFREARFCIGDVVRHRHYPFRGVIYDVDPVYANTEEWWLSIPEEVRPSKDQPFYHLLAENEESTYVAYVSEQNLVTDESGLPVSHPHVSLMFAELKNGRYIPTAIQAN